MPRRMAFGTCLLIVFLLSNALSNAGPLLANNETKVSHQTAVYPLSAELSDSPTNGQSLVAVGDKIDYEAKLMLPPEASVPVENIQFQVDLDKSLTQSADFQTTPLAYNDTYTLASDSLVQVPANIGLLAGSGTSGAIYKNTLAADQDFDATPGVMAVAQAINTDNGTVFLAPDGSFSFENKTGARNFSDTFVYTIVDEEGETDQGSVTLTFESEGVIFVNNQAAQAGNGTLEQPYQTLNQALSAADKRCDVIFLFASPQPYQTEAVQLADCQKLIGQDYGPYSFAEITGLDAVAPAATGSNRPIISCSRFADYLSGVNPSRFFPTTNQGCITLAQNNVVAGISIRNPESTQKGIAGENVDTFWGFNLSILNSDGISLSCNDDQAHTIRLTDQVSVQNYGFIGMDVVGFGNSSTASGRSCAINLAVNQLDISDSQNGAAEAIHLISQRTTTVHAYFHQTSSQNIAETVLRAATFDDGNIQLRVTNANFQQFDSVGIYLENYIFRSDVSEEGGVQASISSSTLIPNKNGRAFAASHQGNRPTTIALSQNTVGSLNVQSDGFTVYGTGLGQLNVTVTENDLRSSGSPAPNLPSDLSHQQYSTIYFENMMADTVACFSAQANTSVAGRNFGLDTDSPAIRLKAGPAAGVQVAGWDGYGGIDGAEQALETLNPDAELGAGLETLGGGEFMAGNCPLPSIEHDADWVNTGHNQPLIQAASRLVANSQPVSVPVLPAGKSVLISFSATVNDNAPAADYVSAQGVYTISDLSDTFTTIDPEPLLNFPNDGRTKTELEPVPPTLQFNNGVVAEETGQITIDLTLSEPSAEPITLSAVSKDGTANAGTDYTPVDQTVIFAPGQTEATLDLYVLTDTLVESDERFFITLTAGAGSTVIIPGDIQITIQDSPPQQTVPTLILPDVSIDESEESAFLNISLSTAAAEPIEVNYVTVSGSAVAGTDFLEKSGTLTFNVGMSQQVLDLAIIDDTSEENDEVFFVNFSANSAAQVNIIDTKSQITIRANDQISSIPTLVVENITVSEGAGTVQIPLTLSEPSSQPITIWYAPQAGSAMANSDYVPLAGEVVFPAGTTAATAMVQLVDDQLVEDFEFFTVLLEAAPSSSVSIPLDQVIISVEDDDEPAGPLQLSAPDVQTSENSTAATITVQLNEPAAENVLITFETYDGSAVSPDDFAATSGTVLIVAGNQTTSFDIPLVDDDIDEIDEYFYVRFAADNPSQVEIKNPEMAVTIVDNDQILIYAGHVTGNVIRVIEDEGAAQVDVVLSRASSETVEVNIETSNLLAMAGEDYTAIPSTTLVFAPGEVRKTVSIPIIDDGITAEGFERFRLNMSGPINADIFGNDYAEIVIVDNDNSIPWIYFEFADYAIYEDMDNDPATASELVVAVQLSHAVTDDVTATVITSNGTAEAPGDFQALNQEITIPAGSRDATVTVSVNEDGISERPETFLLVFDSGTSGAIVDPTQSSTTVTIADGTPPVVRVNNLATIQRTQPLNGTATFQLQLVGNVILPVRFNIGVQNQTDPQAISNHDGAARQWHQLNPGTKSFAYNLPLEVTNLSGAAVDDPLFEMSLAGLNGAVKADTAGVTVIQGFEPKHKLFLPFISK